MPERACGHLQEEPTRSVQGALGTAASPTCRLLAASWRHPVTSCQPSIVPRFSSNLPPASTRPSALWPESAKMCHNRPGGVKLHGIQYKIENCYTFDPKIDQQTLLFRQQVIRSFLQQPNTLYSTKGMQFIRPIQVPTAKHKVSCRPCEANITI